MTKTSFVSLLDVDVVVLGFSCLKSRILVSIVLIPVVSSQNMNSGGGRDFFVETSCN